MIEENFKPFMWGAGKSFVSLTSFGSIANKSIDGLTNDELTHLFTIVPMHSKLFYLEEMKRRGITSIVIDLGASFLEDESIREDKIMESMESFALLAGGSAEQQLGGSNCDVVIIDGKGMATDDFKELIQIDLTQCRDVGAPKPNSFYKSLNAKHNKAFRR